MSTDLYRVSETYFLFTSCEGAINFAEKFGNVQTKTKPKYKQFKIVSCKQILKTKI